MGAETDRRPGPRRKTLDDIRRELDQHVAAAGQTPHREPRPATSMEESPAGVDAEPPGLEGARPSSWLRRFLVVALIGCITAEIALIADIVIGRYERHVAVARDRADGDATISARA